VVDVAFTARMEEELDEVAAGRKDWVPMVRSFWEPFSAKIAEGRTSIPKQVEMTDIDCPISGHKMMKRYGRNGWFLGCSAFPECKHSMPLPGEEPELPADLPGVGLPCPECGIGTLAVRRGRFGPFVGCDRYPECKHIVRRERDTERFGICPTCGIGTVVTKHARSSRRPFWGCDRYPQCDYTTGTRPATAEGAGEQPAGVAGISGG